MKKELNRLLLPNYPLPFFVCMKRVGVLLFFLAFAQLVPAQSLSGPSALSVRIQEQRTTKRAASDLVLALEFRNTSQKPIRIMAAIGSVTASTLNVLNIYLKQKGENMILLGPAGKVDYEASVVYAYETISPGKTYKKLLNISQPLRDKSILLKPGAYKVQLYYHNQHGENCLKGVFPSNALYVRVGPTS
jgi:hypothetical protein